MPSRYRPPLPGCHILPGRFRQTGVTRKNGKEITMDARFNYQGNTVVAKFAKYINSAGAVGCPIAQPCQPRRRELTF